MIRSSTRLLLTTTLALAAGCSTPPERSAPAAVIATPSFSEEEPSEIHELIELLVRRLTAPDTLAPEEARRALLLLIEAQDASTLTVLTRCARDDPDEGVRVLALDAIHRLDSPSAAGVLMRASVNDPSGRVKRHAWELLLADSRAAR